MESGGANEAVSVINVVISIVGYRAWTALSLGHDAQGLQVRRKFPSFSFFKYKITRTSLVLSTDRVNIRDESSTRDLKPLKSSIRIRVVLKNNHFDNAKGNVALRSFFIVD